MIERAVLISGTVGAGKTTVGEEVAELLVAHSEPNAFIDLDRLSELWPTPLDDPFNVRLILANLTALGELRRCRRTRTLVMSGVVETHDGVEGYRAAVGGCPLTVVRVTASHEAISNRLRSRHAPWDAAGLAWHLDRAPGLAASLEVAGIESFTVLNDADPRDVARQVLGQLGWIT